MKKVGLIMTMLLMTVAWSFGWLMCVATIFREEMTQQEALEHFVSTYEDIQEGLRICFNELRGVSENV